MRENQRIISKAVYLALGVTMEGHKELLGMWISESEGAKFWLAVCTELCNWGMKYCYIACVDSLMGFPEAIETVFPQTQVQLCLVYMVRKWCSSGGMIIPSQSSHFERYCFFARNPYYCVKCASEKHSEKNSLSSIAYWREIYPLIFASFSLT